MGQKNADQPLVLFYPDLNQTIKMAVFTILFDPQIKINKTNEQFSFYVQQIYNNREPNLTHYI